MSEIREGEEVKETTENKDASNELDREFDSIVNGEKEGERKELPEIFDNMSEEEKKKNIEAYEKLSPEAKEHYDKCAENEKKITPDVKDSVEGNGAHLVGEDHRLKTPDSFSEKIGTRAENEGKTEAEALAESKDVVRYTCEDEKEFLVDDYEKVTKDLTVKGYQVDQVKNTWEDEENPYKGVNVIYESPDGQKFEVQYHTPESFKAKEEQHKYYEELRTLDPEDPEYEQKYAELSEKMYEISDELEEPDNIDTVKSFKNR